MSCKKLGFSCTYSPPSSLRALTNCYSCDSFRKHISSPSMTSLPRWMAQISMIVVQFDVRCSEFSSSIHQNLQTLFCIIPTLAICFMTSQCSLRKPVRTHSLFLLSSSMIFVIWLLKFLSSEIFSQKDALSCSSLLFFGYSSLCHRIGPIPQIKLW